MQHYKKGDAQEEECAWVGAYAHGKPVDTNINIVLNS